MVIRGHQGRPLGWTHLAVEGRVVEFLWDLKGEVRVGMEERRRDGPHSMHAKRSRLDVHDARRLVAEPEELVIMACAASRAPAPLFTTNVVSPQAPLVALLRS